MSTADVDWMQLALSDPTTALTRGDGVLRGLGDSGPGLQSEILRAMSMAARSTGAIPDSVEFARRAVSAAEHAGDEEKRLMAMLTLSGSLAIAGETPAALQIIGEGIDDAADRHLRARFTFQRGAVLDSQGHQDSARRDFIDALPEFERAGDEFSIGLTLNRLGQVATDLGRLSEAESYLRRALSLAERREEWASVHGIQHNLGLLASYRGDIPGALRWLERSDELFMSTTGARAPQHVARAEVLISAGLFDEALQLATSIAGANRRRADTHHLIDSLMVAARAALFAGRYDTAVERADEAARLIGVSAGSPLADEAAALSTEAGYRASGPSPELLNRARDEADRLAEAGLRVSSAKALLLAARIAAGLDDPSARRAALTPLAEMETGPFELRIQGAMARASLRADRGDRGSALRSVRSGLRVMDSYQSVLSAMDLRMGLEKHGAELAALGLELAWDSGRPRRILEWLDQARARSLRFRPVHAGSDARAEELLSQLRRIEAELRDPASQGDRSLLTERRRLQDEIARTDRTRRGTEGSLRGLDIEALIGELGDRMLIEWGVLDGRLIGVTVDERRAAKFELGPIEEVEKELAQVRFAMRRAARRGIPPGREALRALEEQLLGDIDSGGRPVVVVPPPRLMAAPWGALSRFGGSPISVAPSAEIWLRSLHRDDSKGTTLVAGGPDLVVAGREILAVGELYDDAAIYPNASVEQVKSGIDGAMVAHIACHASFSAENPMFSSLRLGDGDLNVYDIERLDTPPALVVLSACDSGYTETRVGDELAGLTSALLSMGTRTVVASVGLVPDSPATSGLMVDLHSGLTSGLEPSVALALAQAKAYGDPDRFVSAASFICVGA